MKNFFLIVLLTIAICSCGSQKEEKAQVEKKGARGLSISNDSITFQLPTDFSGYTTSMHYIGNEKVMLLNTEVFKLLTYNIGNGELVNEIEIAQEGPNSVPAPQSFKFLEEDSIALMNDNTITFINKTGEVLHKINWIDFGFDGAVFTSPFVFNTSADRFEMKFEEDGVEVGGIPNDIFMREANIEDYKSTLVNLKIDLGEQKMHADSLTYPTPFFKDGVRNLFYSRTIGADGKYVYSFQDHAIYKEGNGEWTAYPAKSEAFNSGFEIAKEGYAEDPGKFFEFIYLNDRYGSIVYDEFRNVYYRFAFPKPQGEISQDQLFSIMMYPQEQHIILLDSSLTKIDELRLPLNQYVLTNYFVSPEGLYISSTNPENPTIREDELVFRKIAVEK